MLHLLTAAYGTKQAASSGPHARQQARVLRTCGPRLNLTDFLDFARSFSVGVGPIALRGGPVVPGGLLEIFACVRGTDRWDQGDRYRTSLVGRSHRSHLVVPPKTLYFPRGPTGLPGPIVFGLGCVGTSTINGAIAFLFHEQAMCQGRLCRAVQRAYQPAERP